MRRLDFSLVAAYSISHALINLVAPDPIAEDRLHLRNKFCGNSIPSLFLW